MGSALGRVTHPRGYGGLSPFGLGLPAYISCLTYRSGRGPFQPSGEIPPSPRRHHPASL